MARSNDTEHVLISGASRGLGAALAAHLLAQRYAVSGFSRAESDASRQLQDRYPDQFRFATVDAADSGAIAAFVGSARAALGPIYGLINNAATVQEGILATLPEVDIMRMLEINLGAAIRLTRLCVRDMVQRSRGRVINISSILGSRGYNGLTVYSATKAGLDGFTRSLAREVGRRNVTVNSIAPGYMQTVMSAGLNERELGQIVRRTPLGRLAEIDDVLPLAEFLLSPRAAFISGQTIVVDGGLSS